MTRCRVGVPPVLAAGVLLVVVTVVLTAVWALFAPVAAVGA